MGLPDVDYYSLGELADRWETSVMRIQHYVETGKLECVYWLKQMTIEYGKWKLCANGFEIFEPLNLGWFKGFVGVYADDARMVFREARVRNALFYSLESDGFPIRLIEGESHKFRFKSQNVLYF